MSEKKGKSYSKRYISELNRKYYEQNKDKILQKRKEYYAKNKQKILEKNKERCKIYYKYNKTKILKKRRLYEKKYPERIKAIFPASKIEILENQSCEICGENKATCRHHEDYSKPLKVNFLCHSCHKTIHSNHVY